MAGINRPKSSEEFTKGNLDLTHSLCAAVERVDRLIPIVFASSTQAELDNDYGNSKRGAEEILLGLKRKNKNPIFIYRLPNVFGKWALPNYNSAVATFCHNITRGLAVEIHDPASTVRLAYIDDVVDSFLSLLNSTVTEESVSCKVLAYETTVGMLVQQLQRFRESQVSSITERVGSGLTRALYATYVSYLPPDSFVYPIEQHADSRGVFVEMLRTPDCGQFSFFSARPGITRGGHYHHSKNEKFLVVKGEARFRFRHIYTNQFYEVFTSDKKSEIVQTSPGWAHDITNVGHEDLICILWANEIFDRDNPDTISSPIPDNFGSK